MLLILPAHAITLSSRILGSDSSGKYHIAPNCHIYLVCCYLVRPVCCLCLPAHWTQSHYNPKCLYIYVFFLFFFFSSFFKVLYNLGSCMYHVLLQFFHMNLHSTRYDNMLGTLWQFFDLVLSRNIIEVGGIQISAYYLCSRCCWCPHCLQTDARRCWLTLTLTDWLCDLLRSSVSFHTRLYLSE